MEIKKFLGLSNANAPERLKPGMLEVALDVDVDNTGGIRTRRGQTSVSATASHSLFATADGATCLVAQGQDLKRMDESGALTTLRRLQYGGPIRYAEYNGVVYFTNGVDTGRVVAGAAREWGVRRPLSQPAAAPTGGNLPPGRYMYAMTFLRADGEESGSQPPGMVELTSQGGIAFSGLETSPDPDVAARVLYMSAPNGAELYRALVVPTASSVTYANAALDLGPPLHPDPVLPPPPGQALEVHGGALYVAVGSTVYASDQFMPERFRLSRRFLQFPGPVTMLASVEAGMYVATDSATWYLDGAELDELRLRKVLTYGAVPGTLAKFNSGDALAPADKEPPPTALAAVWTSSNGVIIGQGGGQVINLTEELYSFPLAVRGAGMFRNARGYSTYVVSHRGNGVVPNAY